MKHIEDGFMTATQVEQDTDVAEEMGYDVPFVTYTWERWQEMQVRAILTFTRFQRAVEEREAKQAFAIAMELQEVSTAMQKEAAIWIGVPKR